MTYEFLYVADTESGTEYIGRCQTCWALVVLEPGLAWTSPQHTEWHEDRDKRIRVAAMGFGL